VIIRKTDNSSRFVSEWLRWSEDPRLLTDVPNTQGLPDYADFIDHRHDQSIFSLLTKKHGVPAFRDPSQWGNSVHAAYPNSSYPQIINHVRRISGRGSFKSHFSNCAFNNPSRRRHILQAGNLRNCIPLIGWLKRADQQCLLTNRLLCMFWIDATGADEHELAHTVMPSRVDDIILNLLVS